MSTSTLLFSLFQYKAWANAELFVELEKLDPQARQSECHLAIRLLNHIHVVDRIFVAHLSGQGHGYTATNTTETPTLAELRDAVAQTDRWYQQYIEGLSPQQLEEKLPFVFTDGLNGLMSREEMLAHAATHGGYHRGAVGRIMAQAEVPPPRDIFTVHLHRAEPGRRERGA